MGEKSPHGLLLDPTNATNHEKPHYHKPSKKKKKKKIAYGIMVGADVIETLRSISIPLVFRSSITFLAFFSPYFRQSLA